MTITLFHLAAWAALAIVAVLVLLVFFEPGLPYRITPPGLPLDSHQFLGLVTAVVDAQLLGRSSVKVLTDGRAFYEAELAAIRAARHSVHLEAFVFRPGEVSEWFLEALTERARAGVAVRVVIDAIGSVSMRKKRFDLLMAAGGQVFRYYPIRWYTLKRFNNRTHRELIVIDGTIGFVGGAGMADWWARDGRHGPAWRDTMIRIEGDLVGGLQTTFVENWLEASGEVLCGLEYFPFCRAEPPSPIPGDVNGLVVSSTPSAGRATRARMLFQLLIASAHERIEICSPYFVPDRSMREELTRAARRGVVVQVITPGRYNDHRGVRWASRRLYGELLRSGIEIHEYAPAMIHAKIAIVDSIWSVIGSTNFDNRSFGLNDEVNVAIVDREVAARVRQDFTRDLERSHAVSLDEWAGRSVGERMLGVVMGLFDRQQ